MVTVLLLNTPDTPDPGAVNVTLIPGTGLLPTSLKVTASAFANALLMIVVCGVVPVFELIDTGGPGTIVVASFAVGLLLAPPPDAVAELVIELVPTGALLFTFTVSVSP